MEILEVKQNGNIVEINYKNNCKTVSQLFAIHALVNYHKVQEYQIRNWKHHRQILTMVVLRSQSDEYRNIIEAAYMNQN